MLSMFAFFGKVRKGSQTGGARSRCVQLWFQSELDDKNAKIAPPAFNYRHNDRNLIMNLTHTMNNRFKLGINSCWQSFPWPLFFNGTQTQVQRWGPFELINLTLGCSAVGISLPWWYITGQMNFNHLLWRNSFSSRPSVTRCHFCRLHSGLNFPETLLSSVKCSNQRMIKS